MATDLQLSEEMLSPPGDTIQETIDTIQMTQAELAERLGRPKEKLNDLIKGREPLTRKTALLLERVLDIPVSFWLNRENAYREELMRIDQQKFLDGCIDWMEKFPVRLLKKMGMLPDTQNKYELSRALLKFFRVASPKQWESIYLEQELTAAFKISLANTTSPHAISAWLQIGEIKAMELKLPDFDKMKFKETLQQVKSIVIEQPTDFHLQLQKKCAQAGVAILFTPGLPKAPVSGATWWRRNTPIIQMTDRYKTNDHFWFALYHEAGHILLHGKKEVFLEDLASTPVDEKKELEANLFAQKHLFPIEALTKLLSTKITTDRIADFARIYKTHPGVIVGQLQHAKQIDYNQFNEFKIPIKIFN